MRNIRFLVNHALRFVDGGTLSYTSLTYIMCIVLTIVIISRHTFT